jgi:hypothetical protein
MLADQQQRWGVATRRARVLEEALKSNVWDGSATAICALAALLWRWPPGGSTLAPMFPVHTGGHHIVGRAGSFGVVLAANCCTGASSWR